MTRFKSCATASAYAQGWSNGIDLTGWTAGKAPQIGQLLAFGVGATRQTYTVIEVDVVGATATVYLDRPLTASVLSGACGVPRPLRVDQPGLPPGRGCPGYPASGSPR